MIGVFKKKSELPEYLAHYGMHRAPFSSGVEDDMYYVEPTRKQRLDILMHLTQYTSELLVVIGEEGMGKTTFLNQFIRSAAEHWKLCYIEGHKMMTEEQFLQRIYMGFGIAHASIHKSAMLANLKKRLDNLLQQSLPVIILIDDAHLCSSKILSLILDIASTRNAKTGNSVRIILFSEPQIKIMLAEPDLDEKHRLIVRKIDLPPLDEMHTGNYLHHRLSQAGMATEQFLTKTTISKIYKQSQGIPLKINEAADKLLFETTPIIRRTSNVQAEHRSISRKYIILILLMGILATIIAFQFFFKDNNNNVVTGQLTDETITPLKLPEPQNQLSASDDAATSVSVTNPNETIDPMQALKDELAAKSGKNKPKQETVAEKTNIQQPSPATSPGSKPATNEKANTKTAVVEKAAEKQIAFHDETWIVQQNPDYYTLQLVAGHQQSTIHNFINKHQLSNDQLAYFFSKRNEKSWHNLTYGIYIDRKAANDAIKQLPSELAKVQPWIRQLRSIQTEIAKSR